MKKIKELHGFYPKYPVADAGYGSYDNYFFNRKNKMELYQKYTMFSKEKEKKYKTNPFRAENFKNDNNGNYICPNNKKLAYTHTYKSKLYKFPNEIKVYECESCVGCTMKPTVRKQKAIELLELTVH